MYVCSSTVCSRVACFIVLRVCVSGGLLNERAIQIREGRRPQREGRGSAVNGRWVGGVSGSWSYEWPRWACEGAHTALINTPQRMDGHMCRAAYVNVCEWSFYSCVYDSNGGHVHTT